MQEVAREQQVMRQVHGEAIEAQKQDFRAGLERLEKLWDLKLKLLEDEIKSLKNSKKYSALKVAESTLGKEISQSAHANTN